MSQREPKETDTKQTEAKTEEKEEEKPVTPKKPRRVAPKFELEYLGDKNKGLESLEKKFSRIDISRFPDEKTYLNNIMRTYQSWMYQLFPADFGDMCQKIGEFKGVHGAVKDYTNGKRGADNILVNHDMDSDDDFGEVSIQASEQLEPTSP